MASHLAHPKYRPDIDGLRALAVLTVVSFHAFPDLIRGGFIGVDIFFVISGFLISTIIYESLDGSCFSLLEFYARRILRIYPALILVLFSCLAFGWLALTSGEYKQLGKHVAGGAAFVSNLVLWSESGYFDNSADKKPLLHLWSLGVEEQFYIVWPILLIFSHRKRLNLFAISLIIATISFYLNVKQVKTDFSADFYSPQTRFWELMSGSILAWIKLHKTPAVDRITTKLDKLLNKHIFSSERENNCETLANIVSVFSFIILMYGFFRINKDIGFPGKWAVIPVLGATLIVSSGPNAFINRTILSNRISVWFGLISFPLYLWHWPILSFARIVEGETPSSSIQMSAVALSVVLAWLTYKFIEHPLRFGRHKRAKVTALAILMVIIGYFGYNIYKRDGKHFTAAADILSIPDNYYLDCGNKIKELSSLSFNGGCRLSKDMEPTILFIGDSHADQYRRAVFDAFHSDAVLMIVETACLPFSNDHMLRGECRKKYVSIIDYLEENKSIRTVILSGYWSYLISGGFSQTGENWRNAQSPSNEDKESFKKNAIEFISRALGSGKEVILFRDIPDLDFNVEKCLNYRPLRISRKNIITDCWIDERKFTQRIKPYDDTIEDVLNNFPKVKIFNPRKYLCENGKCFASDNVAPYYHNGDHVNHYGAKKIIDGLFFDISK